jgi:hypothetical protein
VGILSGRSRRKLGRILTLSEQMLEPEFEAASHPQLPCLSKIWQSDTFEIAERLRHGIKPTFTALHRRVDSIGSSYRL